LIFTRGLGIGDDDAFDLGKIFSAIIRVVIVLLLATFVLSRMRRGRSRGRPGHARGYQTRQPDATRLRCI